MDDSETELIRRCLTEGEPVKIVWRQLHSEGAFPASYDAAQTIVRRARAEQAAGESAETIAARMLALCSAELSRLERSKGPKDLERLERLSRTVAQIQRISPKGREKKKEPALLDLLQSSSSEDGREASEADPKDLRSEEGVRLGSGS